MIADRTRCLDRGSRCTGISLEGLGLTRSVIDINVYRHNTGQANPAPAAGRFNRENVRVPAIWTSASPTGTSKGGPALQAHLCARRPAQRPRARLPSFPPAARLSCCATAPPPLKRPHRIEHVLTSRSTLQRPRNVHLAPRVGGGRDLCGPSRSQEASRHMLDVPS